MAFKTVFTGIMRARLGFLSHKLEVEAILDRAV
jgi:hypothetical protein